MNILVSVWNDKDNKWDERDANLIRLSMKFITVELDGNILKFNRRNGLLIGLSQNKNKDKPNHTAPYIDATEIDRLHNMHTTNKPLYARL